MRQRSRIQFIASIFFITLILLCRPLTVFSATVVVPASIHKSPTEKSLANSNPSTASFSSTPSSQSDIVLPKSTEAIPAGKTPAEISKPQSGQSGEISNKPQSGEVLKPSEKSESVPSQNPENIKKPKDSIPPTSSLAYPTNQTSSGVPDDAPKGNASPYAPMGVTTSTPSEYRPGSGATGTTSNTPPPPQTPAENPRAPAYIPRGDQRPLNERPEEGRDDSSQRQFD
jgi:hypothetical protein